MRHSRLGSATAFAIAASPGPASANAGIGLLSPSLLVTIPALLPAILVEAVVYRRMLAMKTGRALGASAWANFLSTLLGGGIAIAFDVGILGGGGPQGGLVLFLGSLVPMFFLSWWIERFFVRRMTAEEQKPRVTRATLVANLVTYALMAVAVCFLVPLEARSVSRQKVGEGLALMYAAKADVAAHYAKQQAFPPPRPVPTEARFLRSAAIERDGRIVAVFSFPSSPDADGKRVLLDPKVEGGRIVDWACSTPDMPVKYLPANCRQPPPGK